MSEPDFDYCMNLDKGDMDDLSTEKIKACTTELLRSGHPSQTDKEILSFTVPSDKADKVEFLKAYTKWPSTGVWKDVEDDNLLFDVEFQDTENEKVGEKITDLLETLNEKEIGEDLLYSRQREIESSTLEKPYY